MPRRNKVTVVGAGNVGATCAHWIATKELADQRRTGVGGAAKGQADRHLWPSIGGIRGTQCDTIHAGAHEPRLVCRGDQRSGDDATEGAAQWYQLAHGHLRTVGEELRPRARQGRPRRGAVVVGHRAQPCGGAPLSLRSTCTSLMAQCG